MKGLLVDDDALFLQTLQRSLARRHVDARVAIDSQTALALAAAEEFDFALLDLRIDKESGLKLIAPLKQRRPGMRVIIMTGYASVATAVEAIKSGAEDYLLKPVGIDAILRALTDDTPEPAADAEESMIPLGRIEWEHIQQALRTTDGNVSAAARLLGVHRRSLQRKLAKRPPG
jgi:two-component system, response regulator RegA